LHHFFKGVEVEFLLLWEFYPLYLETLTIVGVLLEVLPACESVKASEISYGIKVKS
jgi:hypothetical protein